MKHIDLTTWKRKKHFDFFKNMALPHYNLCANVDITNFLPFAKKNKLPISPFIVYLVARTANEIPEFKQRIRGNQVVEHESIQPSFTVLMDDDTYSFCTIDYTPNAQAFIQRAEKMIAHVKAHPTLEDEPHRDDWLFISVLPWVRFTSFSHPMHVPPTDSVPRFIWGKFFKENERTLMPFGVQAHHALADGLHISRYFQKLQQYLDQPATLFER